MSLSDAVNERDNALAWAHHVSQEVQQVRMSVHPQLYPLVSRCIHVYWELFAAEKVSACSVFGAIQLLQRYCATCASTHKFQRVGAACLWIALKLAYGQDVPLCARLLCLHWNDVVPRPGGTRGAHFYVKWHKVVATEVHVLQKLQYAVSTITAHDMFVLLLRLHRKGTDEVLFGRGVQMLITMTLSPGDVPYLPSQVAVAVALTCGLHVDARWLVEKWEEAFAWIQRFAEV